MKIYSVLCLILSCLLVSGTAQEFKQLHGSAVQKNVTQILNKISWKEATLDSLKKEAQDEKKMIFWLQLVGKLDDGL